jgi:serine/threonine protein kinase
MGANPEKSLSDDATMRGAVKRRSTAEMSLGGQQTLGGGDRSGQDTFIDDIEIVDLEARYRVDGTLGQGGMGAVLLATDTRLDRKVAIKRILGEAAGNRMAVQRFLTEAKAIAALNHPNIVQIYDYGRAKDGPFLIMEYVDGGSVADRCKQGALSLDETVSLACQICDGLDKAHDAGIVHRDIKPANVLLNRDGHPKLTDFGLARAESADHGMTMTGAVMGTPDFMPPEQRRDAAEVDHRSDLWSLAATVYQMATGRSPKIIRFNDIPPVLQDVLAKALEDRKDDRYQSAREFRDALRRTVTTVVTPTAEFIAGQCGRCGTVNDVSRKFCSSCGASLRVPCLACGTLMGGWENICGECGGNQPELLAAGTAELTQQQIDAENLLEELRLHEAKELLEGFRDLDQRFAHFRSWREGYEGRLRQARESEEQRTRALVAEALHHETACDYQAAIHAIEKVPPSFRECIADGVEDSPGTILARVTQKQSLVHSLGKFIRQAIADRQLDDLLPKVSQLLELCPHRTDVAKIKKQLEERQSQLARKAATTLQEAKKLLENGQRQQALDLIDRSGLAKAHVELSELLANAEQGVSGMRGPFLFNEGDALKRQRAHNRLVATAIVFPLFNALLVGFLGSQKWMPPGLQAALLLGFFVLTPAVVVTCIRRVRKLYR